VSTSNKNPGATQAALEALLAGLKGGLPANVTQITVNGQTHQVVDLQAEVQDYVDLYGAADEAAKAHVKAVQARDAKKPAILARLSELRAGIKTVLGRRNPDLSKFGMTPDKVPEPLTVDQKKQRAAKARATRAARHTMGPKAKKAVKGQAPSTP
jgi:hypothetical protein